MSESFESWIHTVSNVFVVVAHALLLSSRFPQIILNIRHKSVEAISFTKLILIFVSNLSLLTASILFWAQYSIYFIGVYLILDASTWIQYLVYWRKQTSKKVAWKHVSLRLQENDVAKNISVRRLSIASRSNPSSPILSNSYNTGLISSNILDRAPPSYGTIPEITVFDEENGYNTQPQITPVYSTNNSINPNYQDSYSNERIGDISEVSPTTDEVQQCFNENPCQECLQGYPCSNPNEDRLQNDALNSSLLVKASIQRSNSELDQDSENISEAGDIVNDFQQAGYTGDLCAYDTDESVYSDYESAFYKGKKNSSWKIVSGIHTHDHLHDSIIYDTPQKYGSQRSNGNPNRNSKENSGLFSFIKSSSKNSPHSLHAPYISHSTHTPHIHTHSSSRYPFSIQNQESSGPQNNMSTSRPKSTTLYFNISPIIILVILFKVFDVIYGAVHDCGVLDSIHETMDGRLKASNQSTSDITTLWILDSNLRIAGYIFVVISLSCLLIGEFSQFLWNMKRKSSRGLSRISIVLFMLSCVSILISLISSFMLQNNNQDFLGVFLPLVCGLALLLILDIALIVQISIIRLPPKQIIIGDSEAKIQNSLHQDLIH